MCVYMCVDYIRYIPASVWQMFRGSLIVFSTILSYFFLKERRIYPYNWLAVCVNCVGLGLVGLAAVLDSSHNDDSTPVNDMVLGIAFTLVGQMCNACQM